MWHRKTPADSMRARHVRRGVGRPSLMLLAPDDICGEDRSDTVGDTPALERLGNSVRLQRIDSDALIALRLNGSLAAGLRSWALRTMVAPTM
jgi:hypothetical protein